MMFHGLSLAGNIYFAKLERAALRQSRFGASSSVNPITSTFIYKRNAIDRSLYPRDIYFCK